jgi:hypothetical protein
MADLQRLAGEVSGGIIFSSSDPSVGAPSGWLWSGLNWFNITNKKVYEWNGSSWAEVNDLSTVIPNDITLNGTLTIGESASIETEDGEGVTVSFNSATHYIKKLKTKNGIVVELEVEEIE